MTADPRDDLDPLAEFTSDPYADRDYNPPVDELTQRRQQRPMPVEQQISEPAAPPEPFDTHTIGEIRDIVAASRPPQFVIRRALVEGDYGVMAAERKFGKTWTVADIAINVASGGSVLGRFPVDQAGPVLVFAGEGGRRKIDRRMRAVANFYELTDDQYADLPVHVYERAPKLASFEQLARFRATIELIRPVLVLIDPAYLAIAGAETRNLVSMGELLERAQLICQELAAALLFFHHWNKTGVGTNADRFTGSGFAEWGRVLISGATIDRRRDATTGETNHLLKLEITGDEIADQTIYVRRRVWADDPDDLTSPMNYVIERVNPSELPARSDPETDDPSLTGLSPTARLMLGALRQRSGQWLDKAQVADGIEATTTGRRPAERTILEAGTALVAAGLADRSGGDNGIRVTWKATAG